MWAGTGTLVAAVLLAILFALIRIKSAGGKPLPVYGQVADFSLTNQDGQAVSLANLRGHVWVADIIFTRCAGSCPRMSSQMKQLQDALPADSQTKLVSLTTDPTYDTPRILKIYARRFGANPKRWMFLTGTPRQIAHVARDSLKLSAVPKAPSQRQSPNDLFIHSTIFVVIDKEARLRGIFQTTGQGVDARQVEPRILAAVRRLEREG